MECQWNEKSKTKDKMIKTNNTKQHKNREASERRERKGRIVKSHPHLLRQPNLMRSCLISSVDIIGIDSKGVGLSPESSFPGFFEFLTTGNKKTTTPREGYGDQCIVR